MEFSDASRPQRRAESVVDEAIGWLDEPRSEPFFLWVHLFDPHAAYTPPPPYRLLSRSSYDGDVDGSFRQLRDLWNGRLERTPDRIARLVELYDGEVAYADHHLGRLLDRLEAMGAARHAVTCVVADHGESFDEHEVFFNHGRDVYESAVRIPWVMRWPEGRGRPACPAGTVVNAPTGLVDLLPTLLDLLGFQKPAGLEGTSVLPRLEAAGGPAAPVFAEAAKPTGGPEQDLGDLWLNERKARCVREGRWKLVSTPWLDLEELFDVEADPGETSDRLADHPEVAERFRTALTAWESGPVAGAEPLTSDDLRAKLRSLGYVDGD
jgi:arylsulfatase A-like enzyme